MLSCKIPYSIFQGETKSPTLTVFKADGSIQNLAGATLEFQVKPMAGDDDTELKISKSTPVGIVLLDQTVGGDTEGQAQIIIDSADTATLAAREYTYDVVAILPNGDRGLPIKPSPFIVLAVVNQV